MEGVIQCTSMPVYHLTAANSASKAVFLVCMSTWGWRHWIKRAHLRLYRGSIVVRLASFLTLFLPFYSVKILSNFTEKDRKVIMETHPFLIFTKSQWCGLAWGHADPAFHQPVTNSLNCAQTALSSSIHSFRYGLLRQHGQFQIQSTELQIEMDIFLTSITWCQMGSHFVNQWELGSDLSKLFHRYYEESLKARSINPS